MTEFAAPVHWLNTTYFVMPTWKWLAIVAIIAAGLAVFSLIRYFLRKLKNLQERRSTPESFSWHVSRLKIETQATWIVLCILWWFAIDALLLPPHPEKYLTLLVRLILSFNVVKLFYLIMDAVGAVLKNYTDRTPSTLDDHLAPLAVKSFKVIVVVMGFLIVLQNFDVKVMSLLAGLGLGGLALALAAQDAAANLIGSVMIIIDRPFSIGDAVKVNDVEGTVETIGFRSTRIRTYYNSLITVPNSTMAKEKIDNMGVRPYRRIRQVLGLHYDTSTALLTEFCKRVRYLISQDSAVVSDTIQVYFNSFGDSTLNVLVNFHLEVFDSHDELRRQQQIFCEILKVADEMGVQFAYPTRSVLYSHQPVTGQPASTSLTT
jgi:MscS family membrane protein